MQAVARPSWCRIPRAADCGTAAFCSLRRCLARFWARRYRRALLHGSRLPRALPVSSRTSPGFLVAPFYERGSSALRCGRAASCGPWGSIFPLGARLLPWPGGPLSAPVQRGWPCSVLSSALLGTPVRIPAHASTGRVVFADPRPWFPALASPRSFPIAVTAPAPGGRDASLFPPPGERAASGDLSSVCVLVCGRSFLSLSLRTAFLLRPLLCLPHSVFSHPRLTSYCRLCSLLLRSFSARPYPPLFTIVSHPSPSLPSQVSAILPLPRSPL